jgi:hypothetical protein
VVERATVLHGWCDEDAGAAYEAWVHALSGFVRAAGDDLDLAPLAPDLVPLLPELARGSADASSIADAGSDRARLFNAVDALVE